MPENELLDGNATVTLRTMTWHACTRAMERPEVKRLIIQADIDGPAKRIYDQLGFTTIEQQVGLVLS
jgi:hypothetical protein